MSLDFQTVTEIKTILKLLTMLYFHTDWGVIYFPNVPLVCVYLYQSSFSIFTSLVSILQYSCRVVFIQELGKTLNQCWKQVRIMPSQARSYYLLDCWANYHHGISSWNWGMKLCFSCLCLCLHPSISNLFITRLHFFYLLCRWGNCQSKL